MTDFFHEWDEMPLWRVVLARLRTWWRGLETPDPWPPELDRDARAHDAIPVCHRCFLPLAYERSRWFCVDCGAAVGPYNNILPYIRIFSLGEVARSGVAPGTRFSTLKLCGYSCVCYMQFWFLFPVYLFCLCRNIMRSEGREETGNEEGDGVAARWHVGTAILFTAFLLTATALSLWPFAVRTGAGGVGPPSPRRILG